MSHEHSERPEAVLPRAEPSDAVRERVLQACRREMVRRVAEERRTRLRRWSLATGVALALRAKASASRVVVLTGDAELNEGSNWEAVMLAPHLQLENLTLLVIDNGSSTLRLRPIEALLSAFGWDAESVDGRDHGELERSLFRRLERPSATVAVIGEES